MGRQIAIVQADSDEYELLAAIRKREGFLAVPWDRQGSSFEPVELGECSSGTQLIFLARDAGRVLTTQDLAIEWTRTIREKETAQAGRFYLATAQSRNSGSHKALASTMSFIRRLITKTYPMRSAERYPRYVGPHMWELVQRGRFRIVYPNGSEVKLVQND